MATTLQQTDDPYDRALKSAASALQLLDARVHELPEHHAKAKALLLRGEAIRTKWALVNEDEPLPVESASFDTALDYLTTTVTDIEVWESTSQRWTTHWDRSQRVGEPRSRSGISQVDRLADMVVDWCAQVKGAASDVKGALRVGLPAETTRAASRVDKLTANWQQIARQAADQASEIESYVGMSTNAVSNSQAGLQSANADHWKGFGSVVEKSVGHLFTWPVCCAFTGCLYGACSEPTTLGGGCEGGGAGGLVIAILITLGLVISNRAEASSKLRQAHEHDAGLRAKRGELLDRARALQELAMVTELGVLSWPQTARALETEPRSPRVLAASKGPAFPLWLIVPLVLPVAGVAMWAQGAADDKKEEEVASVPAVELQPPREKTLIGAIMHGETVGESELTGLTCSDLRLLRNGVFAHYGLTFSDPQLRAWFEHLSYYKPDSKVNAESIGARLSEKERQTLAMIQAEEAKQGCGK